MFAPPVLSPAPPEAPRYELTATIRPAQHYLGVSGTSTIPVGTAEQKQICFELGAEMRNVKFEVLAPASAAGSLLPTMVNDNGRGSGNWTADLPRAVPAGTPITVRFTYDGGDKTAFVFHTDTDGSFCDGSDYAWYPEFGPGSNRTGKFSVDGQASVLGTVTYDVPVNLQLVATGKAAPSVIEGASSRTAYIAEKPCALGYVVDHFRVLHATGKVPISLYLKSDLGGDQTFVDGITRVVNELTTIYGSFPFPEFSLVEVSDSAVKDAGFGGAGCAGFMMSTTSFLNQGFNYAFFGHEIGHQWWGNEVTHATEAEGEDLLDEGMAQYGSLYCVEHLLGPEEAEQYRKSGFPGYLFTQCGYGYLDMHAAGIDHPLENLDSSSPLAHELACEKMFLVFDQLRRELGDSTFHAGLRAVTRDYAFREITLAEFKAEIERVARRNLGWFWDQWLKRTGTPVLSVDWRQDGKAVSGVLRQDAPYYKVTVPIAVVSADGTVSVQRLRLEGGSAPFHYVVSGQVAKIEIDPGFELLHSTPALARRSEAMIPATKLIWAMFSGSAQVGKLMEDGLNQVSDPDLFGVGFRLHFFRARSLNAKHQYEEAEREAQAALGCVVRDDSLLPTCYLTLMNVEAELKDLDRARWAARSAILCETLRSQSTQVTRSAEQWLAQH